MTQTVSRVMQQRLTRGTPVLIADSFGQAKMRGKSLIVTSKGPVKCNKGGRCAGDWCVGLAVFVSDNKSAKKDKKMGWRADTTKVCLTHLKDESGALFIPPPFFQQAEGRSVVNRVEALVEIPTNGHSQDHDEVTWADLADAHRSGDLDRLALLARTLKSQSEGLKSRVIEAQTTLIEHLTRK